MTPRYVLLAEDDAALRSLLSSVLRADGHRVVAVADGDALLDHVRGTTRGGLPLARPGLVVSDLRMPGVDGLRAFEQLREIDRELPMILMTAFGDARTHGEARRLGAALMLDKPFQMIVLREAVARLLPAD